MLSQHAYARTTLARISIVIDFHRTQRSGIFRAPTKFSESTLESRIVDTVSSCGYLWVSVRVFVLWEAGREVVSETRVLGICVIWH
jgi:hypothetical protein